MIYDEKGEVVENPDLSKGRVEQKKHVIHHDAVLGVEEKWHYETTAEYANGGKDVQRVVDVPGVEAKEAWDEETWREVYIPYTPEELDQIEAEKNKPTMDERMTVLEGKVEGMSEWEQAFKRGVQSA